MPRLLSLLIFVVLVLPVPAAPPFDQPFAELKLTDGRVLKNARLKSFNSSSVFVRCDDGFLQVPYSAFPAEMQSQLARARAAAAADNPPPPPASQMPPPAAPMYRPAPPRPTIMLRPSAEELTRLELAKNKANEWAKNHFHSDALMLSTNVRIDSFDLRFSAPRLLSNRALIYLVQGICRRACTDLTTGNALDPQETVFSVTIEIDSMGAANVVDSSEGPGDQSEPHKQELAAWAAEQKQSRDETKTRRQREAMAGYEARQAESEAAANGNTADLSPGMTQDQVQALWGPPASRRSSHLATLSKDQWTYINKTRDENGHLRNVIVTFVNGQVTSWGPNEEPLPVEMP
ncbi:MAG TPA: outer membrane protein assembly factor BamE [Opitutaceae bacterium]|nr:outer membrane protein assembly factor BamE [Opitutaceae bacterium]